MFSISKLKYFSILIILLLFNQGCDKSKYNVIPYVYVDFTLHIPTDLANLGFGGSVYLKQPDAGLNGIIIYRGYPDEYGRTDYFAYDRTCTYEPEHNCAVELNDGSLAKCPCCGSLFIIEAGAVPANNSKARLPLKEYNTTVEGDFLHITN